MALHDIDKQTDSRANPVLNADDNVTNRMAHETIGTTYKTAGNPDTNRLIFEKGSIQGIDISENISLFMGYDPAISSRPVLRVAKDGFDALTGSGDELIFNSDQNVFKIVQSGTAVVSKAANTTQGSTGVAHGLSYVPLVVAFIGVTGSDYSPVPYTSITLSGADAGKVSSNYFLTATATHVIFFVETPTNSSAYPEAYDTEFNYYILQESAN